LRTLIGSRVLVGKSSCGIIEAATAGTAVVNVGDRQQGRLRAGPAVIDAGESVESITRALGQALRKRPKPGVRTAYGAGRAGESIARILSGLRLSDALHRKQITY
jgi:UDP-N-acetylglucosamine 2-epimerase